MSRRYQWINTSPALPRGVAPRSVVTELSRWRHTPPRPPRLRPWSLRAVTHYLPEGRAKYRLPSNYMFPTPGLPHGLSLLPQQSPARSDARIWATRTAARRMGSSERLCRGDTVTNHFVLYPEACVRCLPRAYWCSSWRFLRSRLSATRPQANRYRAARMHRRNIRLSLTSSPS